MNKPTDEQLDKLEAYELAELVKDYLTSPVEIRSMRLEDREALRRIAETRRSDYHHDHEKFERQLEQQRKEQQEGGDLYFHRRR